MFRYRRVTKLYGLPETSDLSAFEDRTTIQVCVGENEVILRFDNDVSVMIGADVNFYFPGQALQGLEDAKQIGIHLTQILGKKIERWEVRPGGLTRLCFTDGYVVELVDSCPNYESYVITFQDRTIVV